MKIPFSHLLKYIKNKPSIDEVSKYLFQLGHENEIEDGILDIEITPNRGDCLSIIGLLRELSVFYSIDFPKIEFDEEIKSFDLDFENSSPSICKNISFLKIEIDKCTNDYKDELLEYFNEVENKRNNFFTDISNYISYETGQPTHCYDYSKIKSKKIVFKEIKKDHEFNSLLGKKINLTDKNSVFLIDEEIVNLAGIMGGDSTACSKDTYSVLVECAYFNPEYIIGKSVKYDLQSEAAYKFERGADRNCHESVLRRFISIVGKHAKIKKLEIYSEEFEEYEERTVVFDIHKLNNIIGHEIDSEYAVKLLKKLGFVFVEDNIIKIPSYRNDISSQNDIAEEIARCIGFNNIDQKEFHIPQSNKIVNLSIEQGITNLLIDNGFFEIINFPFEGNDESDAIFIDNPLDKNRNYLRTNLKDSMINALIYNERRQKDSIKLFEISNVYTFSDEPKCNKRLAIIASGRVGKDYKNFAKKIDEQYMQNLFSKFTTKNKINFEIISRDGLKSKLKDKIMYLEINIKDLPDEIKDYEAISGRPKKFIEYKKISEQPFSSRDLSFSVSSIKDIKLLEDYINTYESEVLKERYVFDYFKNEKTNEYKIGYRFIFQSYHSTIKDTEVEKIMNTIIAESTSIETVKIPGIG